MLSFTTDYISIDPGTQEQIRTNGFIVLNLEQNQMTLYHMLGEKHTRANKMYCCGPGLNEKTTAMKAYIESVFGYRGEKHREISALKFRKK